MRFIRKGGRVIPIRDNSNNKPSSFDKKAALIAGTAGGLAAAAVLWKQNKKEALRKAQSASSHFFHEAIKSRESGEKTFNLFNSLRLKP